MSFNNKIISYFKLHLLELKYNIFIILFSFLFLFFICSIYIDQVVYLFIKPLLKLTNIKYFIYTEITEFFFLNFYLSFLIPLNIYIPFF